ncbi:MAG: protein phosphatase 2C domain-containing protein [Acidobacteriota bacterium]|nr:protein phosphatase 2C domain-containing protein [Acidobacteriota bacterium]
MKPKKAFTLTSSAVTDRGLNEKRPLNEDSFLADSERGIFAVADGVGGAEAGEVASKTAIEVLDEAFRHLVDGADIEDLMELAIQRANASIHQMAQDHAKFSMMATTIVGLHLDGNVATIGHVGDSRLYRLTPDGQLLRETEDHSVVEEEVRAGRMTPQQAANHPSKNVISRALGAENGVEVDLKVIEVEDGTEFLLCSDGITRHIPDHELRQLLLAHEDLTTVCGELKQRCFERGAEDNLTAVLVCVGTPISMDQRHQDLEKTISPETMPVPALSEVNAAQPMPGSEVSNTTPTLVPPSRQAFPAVAAGAVQEVSHAASPDRPLVIEGGARAKGGVERTMTRFFLFVLLLGALAAAFYGGRRYKGPIPYLDQGGTPIADASQTPPLDVPEDSAVRFERARREVDADPNAWLANQLPRELVRQGIQTPLASSDSEFLYLYGRASLLSGNTDEAAKAFESSIAKADLNPTPANSSLRKEATLGLAAVALKSDKDKPTAITHIDEIIRKPALPSTQTAPSNSSPAPLRSP